MREIKFRGKGEVSGKWCYGNLQIRKDSCCIITPDESVLGTYGKVDKETVGQYTGLKDKNGKEIYEGDIIGKIVNNKKHMGIVKYGMFNCSCCDGVYGWYIESTSYYVDIRNLAVHWDTPIELEVFGNIYENPELLEVKDE